MTDPSATTLLLKFRNSSNDTSIPIVISVGRSQVCVRSVYPEVMHLESILDSFEEMIISRKPTDKENALEFNYRQSERAFSEVYDYLP